MGQGERAIGRVVCVSGSQIVAILDDGDGPEEAAGRLQKGAIVKVAMPDSAVFGVVSGLSVPVPSRDRAQPEIRLAELDLLGEVRAEGERTRFRRGISAYPALGDRVLAASGPDLAAILRRPEAAAVAIGTMQQDPTRPVFVAPDDLLGKHFAVLGTTGSGKSCCVTLLLRGILDQHPNAHIVLLDPHNEYGAAFGDRAEALEPETLQLPYWLLSGAEIAKVVAGQADNAQLAEAASSLLTELIPLAKRAFRRDGGEGVNLTVNTPVPYRLSDVDRMLDDAMGRLDRPESLAPYRWLKARLAVLTADPRYAFMFAGIAVQDNMARIISRIFRVPVAGRPITILDLSAVPSEILDIVASVLLRMAFDLALWSRGAQPILVVCEEAHRYAPADKRLGFEPGSTHDVSLDELSHVGVVPRGLLALASQAGLAGVIGAGEVEGDPAQAGQVARGPALADAAVVLAEDDVQDPVQAVLDPPVVPDGPAEPDGIGLGAGQEVADLARGREAAPAVAADGLDREHGPHVRPVPQARQGVELAADEHAPARQAAVAGVGAVVRRQVVGRAAGEAPLVEPGARRGGELLLVGLEADQVVGVPGADLAGDPLLAEAGVQGDQAARQVEPVEQRRHGGALARAGRHGRLAERDPVPGGVGADQLQRAPALPAVAGVPQGLAVDRDLPRPVRLGLVRREDRADPGEEDALERVRVDQHEDAAEGVVRGDAVRQGEEAPEPGLLAAAAVGHVLEALGLTEHRADGDDQDVDQPVLDPARVARVLDGSESGDQGVEHGLPRCRERPSV